jgi:uncharacterized protein YuzE
MLKLSYDKQGDLLEIRFSESPIESSEYIAESGLVVDYDKEENLVAIEIISFSKRVRSEEAVEAIAL